MTAPLVSIVIPCRNYGHFLGEAIESGLAQTHPAVEVVVVDFGSTDGSDAVAAGYPEVRLVRGSDRGLSEARNAGLAASRGEFVVFLDADDRLVPDGIATSLQYLASDEALAFAYGREQLVDETGALVSDRELQEPLTEDPYGYMLRNNNPLRAPSAILYRRAAVERVGGFAPATDGCEDLDLNFRLARSHRICCNDRVVVLKRFYEESMSRSRWAHMLSRAVMVQRAQRAFVLQHPRYRSDYRTGMRVARSYWGGHLSEQILSDARAGEVRAALRNAAALARYHPAGLLGLPRRAARRVRPAASGRG
jgi:glycosyltransferase involved in cell wall biosynthesis